MAYTYCPPIPPRKVRPCFPASPRTNKSHPPHPVLHGVLSVRTGLYQGLHCFAVTLPPSYPAHHPQLALACAVPHPLIDSAGLLSTPTAARPSLRACLEHLRHVLHGTDLAALARTASVTNQPALDL